MFSLNPIKYFRFISKVIGYSRQVQRKTDLSLFRQMREVYKLFKLNMLEPREYYDVYELFTPDLAWEEKTCFLSRNQFAILDRAVNPGKGAGVLNKLVFKIFAQHFDLPVAKMHGLFDQHLGYMANGEQLRSVADLEHLIAKPELSTFLFKPISANKAMGIIVCAKQNNKLVALGEGEIGIAELHRRLCGSHQAGYKHVADSWLVEDWVQQHPWFDRYSPSYSHHYRIITFITLKGTIELIGATMGIGLQGKYIHQSGLLGISAGVSDDGVMSAAVRGGVNGVEYFRAHPETGAAIAGEHPPGFKETVELAFRAHRYLPHLRLLGWDIAPTEHGPVIFEGNVYWNWEKLQRCNRRGVIRGSLAKELPDILATH